MIRNKLPIEEVVAAAALRDDLKANAGEIRQYAEKIVSRAIENLREPHMFPKVFQMWKQMYDNGADRMISVGGKKLSDFPKARRLILAARPPQFQQWLEEMLKDDESRAELEAEVANRHLQHWFTHMRMTSQLLTERVLAQMRNEFGELEWNKTTRWLFSIFVGLQTTVIEVFIIEALITKPNDE